MTRLPLPGSDEGTWGDILNAYLSVEHSSDGTLKKAGDISGAQTAADVAQSIANTAQSTATAAQTTANAAAINTAVVHNTGNESVGGIKTFSASPVVPVPTTATQAANKTYVDTTASAGTPDADTTTKGKLQLAGDLAGTAASPTVPGLTGKEPLITAGTTSQYYRGDKSWQTLDKTAVGLGNVDNTSDATKNSASVTLTNKTISGASNTLSGIPEGGGD